MSSFGLKEIGKLPLINAYSDPILRGNHEGTFSEYRQKQMRPVDIFPVKFSVNLTDMFALLTNSAGFGATQLEMPITVDFLKGALEYFLKLSGIGICAGGQSTVSAGVRCWVNNETQSTDGVRHSYKENKIVEQFNNMLTTTNAMADYTKSLGIISDPSQGTISSPIAAALLDGRHLSLPMIWEKSTYEPQLDLTVRLISPYGNDKSFYKNIAEPLMRLTALTAPSSYDGVTYGMPANMYIRAYGVTFIPLAICDSFQVVRGGPSGRVNNVKQPLELSVSMSFKPAMPGFAAIIPPTMFDFSSIVGGDISQLVNGAITCAAGGVDPMGVMKDLESPYSIGENMATLLANKGAIKIPGITTLGTIIQSLRSVNPDDARAIPPSLFNAPLPKPIENVKPLEMPPVRQANAVVNTVNNMINDAGISMSTDQLTSMISGTI
jgi:hypothetical protein